MNRDKWFAIFLILINFDVHIMYLYTFFCEIIVYGPMDGYNIEKNTLVSAQPLL